MGRPPYPPDDPEGAAGSWCSTSTSGASSSPPTCGRPTSGLYGSKSGYDSLEECFEDMAGHVHAIETGLSQRARHELARARRSTACRSCPSPTPTRPRTWAASLLSMSGEPSYDGLVAAMKEQAIDYTVEFFPEEGKYHNSGHRKCGVSMSPQDVAARGPQCPVCGRRVTLGVLHRVEELAARNVETRMGPDGLVRGERGAPALQDARLPQADRRRGPVGSDTIPRPWPAPTPRWLAPWAARWIYWSTHPYKTSTARRASESPTGSPG